ncbi:unnamed protein product [Ceutorhynchus assimilis]|nr:unnamed protein product [Ceutorhynchus assimilis]
MEGSYRSYANFPEDELPRPSTTASTFDAVRVPEEGPSSDSPTASVHSNAEPSQPRRDREQLYRKIRGILAYFILGLCNNYGYVVMLTAASDIIGMGEGSDLVSTIRNCAQISTGTILLADILPALLVKLVLPFLPFVVHIRVAICVGVTTAGYLVVGFSNSIGVSILGVVLISFCSGLGEVTYLQYSANYEKSVLSAWGSGSGGAGVIGAVSYSLLNAVGMQRTLLIMLTIPAITSLAFWLLLPKPLPPRESTEAEAEQPADQVKLENEELSLRRKIYLIPGLMKYMIPFGLIYLFEYFINQGTFELIKFPDASISVESQYRWMQVMYQVGVFVSRSSVAILHIKQTWILAVLQGINVIIFTTDAIYYYIPNIYIVLALVLWEGLLGGAAYVNTYYRISNEVKNPAARQFSMAINGFADSTGIALAGVFAIMAHNAICTMPLPP